MIASVCSGAVFMPLLSVRLFSNFIPTLRKREHDSGDEEREEVAVPAKIAMMDVSKKMAPSVSPYEENNSNSSLPDSQHSKSQKKSSKRKSHLAHFTL